MRTKAELMQALQVPSMLAAEHSSGMQMALLNSLFPVGQTGPVRPVMLVQDPLTAGLEFSQQVRQAPERGSKLLQEASTVWQVPLKNCLVPQPWAWMT